MVRLVEALDLVQRLLPDPPVLIGGLALLAQLSVPHRATTDVDTANIRRRGNPSSVELLLQDPRTSAADAAGVLLTTGRGTVKVDVIDVPSEPPESDLADPNDALFELAHAWAYRSADPMVLLAVGDTDEVLVRAEVNVATSAALIAMKLQSAMNRGADKEGTDLLDIVTLVLDPVTGPAGLADLSAAEDNLAAAAMEHVAHWFFGQPERTLRAIQRSPEGRVNTLDDLKDVGAALRAALLR